MSKKERCGFTLDYAVIPGESLREAIEFLGMSQVDFAQRIEMSEQSLNRILKGEQPITYETAIKLERVTGIGCDFWTNLEANYQKQLQIQEQLNLQDTYKEWLKRFPISELCKRNYIQKVSDPILQAYQVLKFFQTSSIKSFENYFDGIVACARGSAAFETDPISAVSYIYMGLREAQSIKTDHYNLPKFKTVLQQVRAMTKNLSANFADELQSLFASAGVALVFVPPFKGLHFNGVSKWVSSNKALIIMNIRGKSEDKFWFSLFHESAHLILHSKKQMFISDSSPDNTEELEADKFAADYLIPSDNNERIKRIKTTDEIMAIADELGIAPGIVVGRYHHLTQDWRKFNNIVRKLEWRD